MTAYDIFSAVGDISDDMLEESEIPAKPFGNRPITHIPMIAAAACLAIFAFGLRYIYYDSGIEQPAVTDSLNSITTDTPPLFSDLVSDTEEKANETSDTEVTTVPENISSESSPVLETSAEISSKTYSTAEKEEEITENTEKTTASATYTHTEKAEKNSETVTAGTSASETSVTETARMQFEADIIISIDTGTVPEEDTSYVSDPETGGHESSQKETAGISVTESRVPEVTGDDEYVDNEDDDEAYEEAYIFLDYGGSRYTQTGELFDREKLTFLCAGEIYDIMQPGDRRVGKSCEVYKINGLSEKYMLAVPTGDGYSGYRNYSYKSDSLAGYIEDTDYLNRTAFTAVRADKQDGVSIKYTLPDIAQAIERLVYSNPTAAEIPYTEITGTTVYGICGAYGGISAFVYESGYVFINNRMFFVGGEYTAAFGEYIKNNAESRELISHTQNSDSVNDEEEDVIEDIMDGP